MAEDTPNDASAPGKGYAVGYRKPPKETRFAKGKSGNPRGRPRKHRPPEKRPLAKLLGSDTPTDQLILSEAYRTVKVREGDRVTDMPVNQAILRAMQQSALKGNRLAQRDYTMLVRSIEAEQRTLQREYFEAMASYKWDAEAEIARCRRAGIEPPEMLPHPDDIILDVHRGAVEVHGPFSAEDKTKFDKAISRRNEAAAEVESCAAKYHESDDPQDKEFWLSEWHVEQRMFDTINEGLPERYRVKLANRSYAEGATRPGEYADIYAGRRKMKRRS